MNFPTWLLKILVKNGMKYFRSNRANPPSFELVNWTSSSSVNSEWLNCSESIACPNSLVFESEIIFSFSWFRPRDRLRGVRFWDSLRLFLPGWRSLRSGKVDPPKKSWNVEFIKNVRDLLKNSYRRKKHNQQCCRYNHPPSFLLWIFKMQAQSIRNRSSQSTEPHDERHFAGYLRCPKFIHHPSEGKNVCSATNQTQSDAPNNQSQLNLMLKGENCKSQILQNARLTDKSQSSHCLLHRDLSDGWEVEMCVMWHNNAAE